MTRRRKSTGPKHWSADDAPEAPSRPLEAWRALDAAPVDEIGVEESKEERPPTPPLFDPLKLPPAPPRAPPASPAASPAPAAAEVTLAAVVVGDVRCSGCVDVASRALESAGLFVERYEADFAKATATFHLLRPAAASAVDAALDAAGVERDGVAFPAPASLAGVVEALLAGGAVRRYACRCGCASCLCADRPVDPSDAGTDVTLEGLCERLEDRGMGDGLRAEVLAEVLRAQGAPAAALLDGWRGRRVPCGCADGPPAREVTGSEAASRLSAWSAAACAAAAAPPEVTASSEAGTWSVASEKSALASEKSGPAAAAASSAATTPSAAASSACPTPSAAGEPAAPAPEPGHLRQPSEISVVSGVTEASFSGHLRRPSEPNSGDSGDSAAAVAEAEARVTASEAGTFASLPSDPADAAASEAGTWTIASLPPEADAPDRGHRRGPSEVSFVSGVTEASLDAPFPAPAPRPPPDAWVTARSKRRHRSAAALAALAPPEALREACAQARARCERLREQLEGARGATAAAEAMAELRAKECAALQTALELAGAELERASSSGGDAGGERAGAKLLLEVAHSKQEVAELSVLLAERTQSLAAACAEADELKSVLERERTARAAADTSVEVARREAQEARGEVSRARAGEADARRAAEQAEAGARHAAAEALHERVRNETMAAELEQARKVHRSDVAVLRAASAEQAAAAKRETEGYEARLKAAEAAVDRERDAGERKLRELRVALDARRSAIEGEAAGLQTAAAEARREASASNAARLKAERRAAERGADADAAAAARAEAERIAALAERGRDNLARQVAAMEAATRLAAEERRAAEGALRAKLEEALRGQVRLPARGARTLAPHSFAAMQTHALTLTLPPSPPLGGACCGAGCR